MERFWWLRRDPATDCRPEAILMTMWEVPDEDTQQLMQIFYERWLAGEDKHQALREAQLALRATIRQANQSQDDPKRWGAFVLVGR